jgi:hydroxymethylpyrimidine pyrophosphatase-like HAD family hydrolase
MKVNDIWERTKKEGRSPKTVRDARKELDIRSVMVMEDGRRVYYWKLYGQIVPGEPMSHPETDELARIFNKMNEEFPPPTPIEEADDHFP